MGQGQPNFCETSLRRSAIRSSYFANFNGTLLRNSVTARLEADLGSAIAAVQKPASSLHLPASIRVDYGGTGHRGHQRLTVSMALSLIINARRTLLPQDSCRRYGGPRQSEQFAMVSDLWPPLRNVKSCKSGVKQHPECYFARQRVVCDGR